MFSIHWFSICDKDDLLLKMSCGVKKRKKKKFCFTHQNTMCVYPWGLINMSNAFPSSKKNICKAIFESILKPALFTSMFNASSLLPCLCCGISSYLGMLLLTVVQRNSVKPLAGIYIASSRCMSACIRVLLRVYMPHKTGTHGIKKCYIKLLVVKNFTWYP